MVSHDRRKIAQLFDYNKPLVATKFFPLNGAGMNPGTVIPATEDPDNKSLRLRLWMSNYAAYAEDYRPTEEAGSQPEHLAPDVRLVNLGAGWWSLRPTWGGEEVWERVRGQEKASERATELLAAGPPAPAEVYATLDFDGYDIDPARWTEEQRVAFVEWYEGMPDGATVRIDHSGAAFAFAQLRDTGKLPDAAHDEGTETDA